MRKNLPPKKNFIGKTIERYPNHVIRKYVASGANGHLFQAFDDSTGSTLAFKVVPLGNLASRKGNAEYLEEAKKANLLEHPSVVRYHDVVGYLEPTSKVQCVVFICDYVNGKSLADYLSKVASREEIDIPFIVEFLSVMFGLLYELQQRGYEHGDLHAGNILVVKSRYDVTGRTTFRVTDFGVRVRGTAAHADYLNVGVTLSRLLDCVDYRLVSGKERFVYNALRDQFLKRHLIETDNTIDPLARNPRALLEKLMSLEDEYRRVAIEKRRVKRLVTPFDYPSCEQIGNSHLLLKALYSDRLLGLPEINARTNTVLTGPRGCGKTTVFRALSLEYLTSTDKDRPANVDYIGIYYRCDDLYFSFPRYKRSSRAAAIDIPMHFLTVTLLGLLLEQIEVWAGRHFATKWGERRERFVEDLWKLFGWQRPNSPAENRLSALIERLKGQERRRAAKAQRFLNVKRRAAAEYFGPGKLSETCALIRERLEFIGERPFYFFVDDYSKPKITEALQANLNRLVMQRAGDVFFKLSTESPVSFARHDIDRKVYAESREFDFVNLGLRYITEAAGRPMEFIDDLFRRRFGEVEGYPVSNLEELLGSSPRNENASARVFRGAGTEEERSTYGLYAGRETIAAMCSGDVHYVIRLVGRMVEDCGGTDGLRASSTTPKISERRQHQSIRAAAGAFMESIRTVPEVGQELAEVVAAFGNVAHSYLLHKNSRNRKGEPPHQASRIEPYEALRLRRPERKILEGLLRYSVLIEDPRGKSRRGSVVPRFYLRRYLIPHFGLTFSRRDSLELEEREMKLMLTDPKAFEKEFRMRADETDARVREGESAQGGLFDDERGAG